MLRSRYCLFWDDFKQEGWGWDCVESVGTDSCVWYVPNVIGAEFVGTFEYSAHLYTHLTGSIVCCIKRALAALQNPWRIQPGYFPISSGVTDAWDFTCGKLRAAEALDHAILAG